MYIYQYLIMSSTIYEQWTRLQYQGTAAVAPWVRAFASQAEGWVFEPQPRQTQVVKTGSDISTAKLLAIGVSFTSPRRWLL